MRLLTRIRIFLYLLLSLVLVAKAYPQQLVNCAVSTPCTTSGPSNTGTGDAAFLAFGKLNQNFNFLGNMISFTTGSATLSTTSGTVLTVNALAGLPTIINGANASNGSALKVAGSFSGVGSTNLVTIADTGNTNGANVMITGNGATTPSKTMRVQGGLFQIVNSGYTSSLLTLADSGNLTMATTGSQPQFAVNATGVNAQGIISAPSGFGASMVVAGNGNGTGTGVVMQQDNAHNGYLRNQDTGTLFLGVASANFWSITPSGELTNGTVPSSAVFTAVFNQATASDGVLRLINTSDNGAQLLISGATDGIRFGTSSSGSLVEGVDQTGSGSYQPLFLNGLTWQVGTGSTPVSRIQINSTGTVAVQTPTSGTAVTVGGISGQLAISAAQPVGLPAFTVATLPTCNTTLKGSMAYVTDATAPTYNAALTGGGAVVVPVFCSGSAWTSH